MEMIDFISIPPDVESMTDRYYSEKFVFLTHANIAANAVAFKSSRASVNARWIRSNAPGLFMSFLRRAQDDIVSTPATRTQPALTMTRNLRR